MYDIEHKKNYTRAAMSCGSLIGVFAVLVEFVFLKIGDKVSKSLEPAFAVLGVVCFLVIYFVGIHLAARWMIKKDDKLRKE